MITTANILACPVVEAPNGQHMRAFLPHPVAEIPIVTLIGIHWHPECDLAGLVKAALDEQGDTREFTIDAKKGIVNIYAFEGTRNDYDEQDDEPADWWEWEMDTHYRN